MLLWMRHSPRSAAGASEIHPGFQHSRAGGDQRPSVLSPAHGHPRSRLPACGFQIECECQCALQLSHRVSWKEERPALKFAGPDLKKKTVTVDAAYVRKQLADIVKDQDLSRYSL